MTHMHSCFCIGPQNGEPLCPCRMKGVTIKNGRYVREEDLGPVNPNIGRTNALVETYKRMYGKSEDS